MSFFKRKYWVRIFFKSGNVLQLKVTKFSMKRTEGGGIAGIEWTLANGTLMHLDPSQIEAIDSWRAWL